MHSIFGGGCVVKAIDFGEIAPSTGLVDICRKFRKL